jgi:hypothetical protein
MNAKKVCALLTIVGLVMPVAAMASLPAPTNLTVGSGADTLNFDWEDVDGAEKYSLDIEAVVTYYDELLMENVAVEVTLSFGTSDRTDGEPISASFLDVPVEDILTALLDQLGIDDPGDIISVEDPIAKVKALAPHDDKGRQNNPFSDSVSLLP